MSLRFEVWQGEVVEGFVGVVYETVSDGEVIAQYFNAPSREAVEKLCRDHMKFPRRDEPKKTRRKLLPHDNIVRRGVRK